MPDRIFLVHGMGLHEPGWHEKPVSALKDAYAQYPALAAVPFETRFQIVPVTFDHRLRAIVKKWQTDATAVGEAAKDANVQLVQDLTGWLREAGETSGNYEWTHAADVLLYRVYPSVRAAIKVHVAAQIAKVVNARKAGESWSVIGYSLGTAVTHDSLHALWTATMPDGSGTGFNSDQERAQVVAQIANTSRVLQTKPNAYESAVKPGAASKKHGCRYFITARHAVDPFTTPFPFQPVAWPDATAEQRGIYVPIVPQHIHQWNVHAFEHYMVNPAVHIPLFRSLLDDSDHDYITDDDEATALTWFKPFGGLEKQAALKIKSWLEDRLPATSETWETLRTVWDWYQLGKHHFA